MEMVTMNNAQLETLVRQLQAKIEALESANNESGSTPSTLAGGSTATVQLRVRDPDTFAGRRDEDVSEWLFQLDTYFRAKAVPAEQRVVVAETLLRGTALRWWMSKGHDERREAGQWEVFLQQVTQKFGKPYEKEQARERLAELRQTGSAAAYIDSFRKLLLKIDDMSNADVLFFFLRGLKADIQLKVREREPKSLEAAEQAAVQVDELIYRSKKAFRGAVTALEQTTRQKPLDRSNVQCYFCGKKGHIKRHCKARQEQESHSNGKGNGKGYGKSNGKGYGKGKATTQDDSKNE